MITLSVNGATHRFEIDPATPLLYALRGELGLNGAKFGCGLGQCGTCTVIVEGEPVYSCLTPIIALQDRRITTVEGLGTAEQPGVLQRAFTDEQAAQCGYCTSGMIMRAGAARSQSGAARGRDPRTHGAKPLPLRHLHADIARDSARERHAASEPAGGGA